MDVFVFRVCHPLWVVVNATRCNSVQCTVQGRHVEMTAVAFAAPGLRSRIPNCHYVATVVEQD